MIKTYNFASPDLYEIGHVWKQEGHIDYVIEDRREQLGEYRYTVRRLSRRIEYDPDYLERMRVANSSDWLR